MTDQDMLHRVLEAGDQRRADRRRFLRSAGAASLAIGGTTLLAACGAKNGNKAPTPTPTPTATSTASPTPTGTPTPTYTDADILNFALNLEYLEAQFYLHAAFGTGLADTLLTGAGTAGAVTGGKQVTFTDSVVQQYAREIAADERAHVTFLRGQLGSAVIAQPAIDISSSATGAFSKAAVAAGLITSGQSFDPYASDENFLLAAFLFEDVGVTAYKGAIGFISNTTFVEAAAGIHAAEAYHAGLIRSTLYAKGVDTPALITNAGKISDARDSLDGGTDDDQGLTSNGEGNIVPTDSDSIAYGRTPAQVLNIAYLSAASVKKGGFFPAGVNGTIVASGPTA
ncbi:ferritin-like domain-containing protein [Sphingomonas koreensis]|nr:ferritin-like domain-containing protein [Sphingomonas koreensis]